MVSGCYSILGVTVPVRLSLRHCLRPQWQGWGRLVNLVCVSASLFPVSSTLLREKDVGEDCVDVMEGEAVSLEKVLKLLHVGSGIGGVGT